ncbi:MAG: DUF2059 domain-containing protein [Rhizobiaceae bacterium]
MFAKTTCFAMTLALSIVASASFAQEYSQSHLAKAREAIAATKATDSFDAILFEAAAQLKNRLSRDNPDQADRISEVVDAEAIALAPRRGDLELEAARLFASAFTEAEMGEIATFFATPAGTKYLQSTPVLARELGKAARIWANGINRDLTNNAQVKLATSGN